MDSRRRRFLVPRTGVLTALVFLCATLPAAAAGTQTAELFEKRIRPVLAETCLRCHGGQKTSARLRVDSRDALLRGGKHGPALVPGDPDASLLIRAVRYQHDDLRMPPGKPLPPLTVNDFVAWVKAGAAWPSAARPLQAGRHWAFEPVRTGTPPEDPTGWSRNAVDRFVAAKRHEKGLHPVGQAARRTLIRRATFDLLGLPPTPEEVEAFVNDPRPDAYERLVDRLLASPQYGERWGRHWLDLVRYADTAGETADYPAPEAWRYRNYVIAAFNRDTPYDQFLTEQLAGDILAARLPPEAPQERYAELVTATGYIAVARRFGFDITKDQHLTIEDTIDTLGKSVLGLTVACARCHDHKFDPVTQKDYYALYGIFDSTRYPFPGCEHTKAPRDLVAMAPPGAHDPKRPPDLAYAVAEGTPHNVRIHKRGDPETPGDEAPRRDLELLGGQPVPPGGGSGRLALAGWLTRPDNPLTARVMVNRIWQHHFGAGLVKTPNDFGTRGLPPSHPELLDYLAARFVRDGWSVKAMHRLLMLSATYQLADHDDPQAVQTDPDDTWLWKFRRRRLSAEEIRDAVLAVSGGLDPSPGGRHPFPDPMTWGFTQHAPFTAVYDTNRRSVYLMTQRIARHPFLALFDGPDPNSSTPDRFSTNVATQALFFMNDPFVHAQSAGLAARLRPLPDDAARLDRAFRLLFGRPPSADEREAALRFLAGYQADLTDVPPAERPARAWSAYARVLLCSNEFLFVD